MSETQNELNQVISDNLYNAEDIIDNSITDLSILSDALFVLGDSNRFDNMETNSIHLMAEQVKIVKDNLNKAWDLMPHIRKG